MNFVIRYVEPQSSVRFCGSRGKRRGGLCNNFNVQFVQKCRLSGTVHSTSFPSLPTFVHLHFLFTFHPTIHHTRTQETMLWVDKHRPKTLDKLSYHSSITTKLQHLGSSGDLPHLLIYGPSGAGKKTRVVALLKEIYGSGVEKLKIDLRQFQTPSGKKVECNVVSSNWHMELTPRYVFHTGERKGVRGRDEEVILIVFFFLWILAM